MRRLLLVTIALTVMISVGYCQEPMSLSQQYSESGPEVLPLLKEKLKNGTPAEKEEIIDIFLKYNVSQLFPDVIEATLDDTPLPKEGDTGWATVYHQAATALGYFASKVDGIDQKKRGLTQFSFHDDAGTASPKRRQEVHDNWAKWWAQNKPGRKK